MRGWLTAIRQTENKTQAQIAAEINVTRQLISAFENGKASPSPNTAQKIAQTLNFEKYGFDWTEFYKT